jgi:hypothetical protein
MFSNVVRRSVISSFLFCAVFVLFAASGFAQFSQAPAFTRIEVEEITSPDQFHNSRSYKITYFNKIGDSDIQVFPSVEEKRRDYDLILARAVRQYLNDAYESQGKYMDEHVVEDANLGQVIDLVSNDYLSSAWSEEDVNSLRQYISRNSDNILLYTLHIYLEHFVAPGKYFSGLDMNPVILDFRAGNKPDIATFIMVNYSDK